MCCRSEHPLLTSKSNFWPVEPESPGLIQVTILKKLFPCADGAQLRLRSPAQDTAVRKWSPVIIGSLGTLPHTSPQCVVIWAFWLLIPWLLLLFNRQVVSDSFVTWRTVVCQAPLSMGFFRQQYWSWLPFPSSGDFPDSGIEPASSALAGGFFPTESPGKPHSWV